MLNPAVTTGLLLRGKLRWHEAAYCIFFQCLGATLASLVAYGMYNQDWADVAYPQVNTPKFTRGGAFVGELVYTFALVTAVLNTATTKSQENNSYFGISIGFVVLVGALVVGPVSGGSFNPAVTMLTFIGGDFDDLWVLWIGPLLGGVLASFVFRLTNPSELDEKAPLRGFLLHISPGAKIPMISRLTMEFIGTFMLTITIALSNNAPPGLSFLAIGAILASMVYAGGAISGAHYNPAVSTGVLLRNYGTDNWKSFGPEQYLCYIATQIVAAFCAGGTAAFINGGRKMIASPAVNTDIHTLFAGFSAEGVFTFSLVLTVLSTATSPKNAGNNYFGVAIGFILLAGVATVADISGGAFNPAIGLALPTIADNKPSDMWVYIVGPMIGSICAAGTYRFWHVGDEATLNNRITMVQESRHDSLKPNLDHLVPTESGGPNRTSSSISNPLSIDANEQF